MEVMQRRSVVTNRNIYSAAHRWAYANGWSTTGAFVAVSLLSYPFALGPAVALSGVSILLALFTLWTEALESGLQSLRDLPDSVNASRHNLPENDFKDPYIDMSDMFLMPEAWDDPHLISQVLDARDHEAKSRQ